MSIQPALEDRETPADAYDLEYEEYRLESSLDGIMRFVGFDEMRARVAQMINERAERKRR